VALLYRRDGNQPRTNKRFLSNIIRNTDEHNKAVLKAQADTIMEARREKEEQERKERRARAAEATDAERIRRLMGGSSCRDNNWDRHLESKRRRRSRDSRAVDGDDKGRRDPNEREHRKRRHRSRSHSQDRDDNKDSSRKRGYRESEESSRNYRRRRQLSRSKSPKDDKRKSRRKEKHLLRPDSRRPSVERLEGIKGKGNEMHQDHPTSTRASPSRALEQRDSDSEVAKRKSKPSEPSSRVRSPPDLSTQFQARKAREASPPPPESPTLSEEEDIERLRPRRRRRASPKRDASDPHGEAVVSKMDKYFEPSYDPRLDAGPMTIPEIPSTGLVDGADFESWEAMLDVIRQRREYKAEQRRLEKAGLLLSGKEKEKEKKDSEAWTMNPGSSVMDIKYSKRGTVREWDLGKEAF
jgi:hypothetical protein